MQRNTQNGGVSQPHFLVADVVVLPKLLDEAVPNQPHVLVLPQVLVPGLAVGEAVILRTLSLHAY